MKNISLKFFGSILLFVFSQNVWAEAPTTGGTLVHAANAHDYKALIPIELYNLVSSGLLVMDTSNAVDYPWNYGKDFLNSQDKDLIKDGVPSNQIKNGFLYDISELKFKGTQKAKSIKKILLNVQAANWIFPFMKYDFSIHLQQDDVNFRGLEGSFIRLYNWRLDEKDQTGQTFREIIELRKPDILKNYSWLTFRFFGDDEDIVWAYSPAIKKAREMTGSNRSDLFADAIAADDFLAWSGKIDNVEGLKIGKLQALTPVASKSRSLLNSVAKNCWEVADTNLKVDQQMRWNYGSKKYPQGASWLPSDTIFVSRQLLKVDLISTDPYSQYGRQTLYLDSESMLPVYKFVYDRAGNFWKSVIMVYGFAASSQNEKISWYPSQMIVIDEKMKRVAMQDYLNVIFCQGIPQDFDMTKFNPRKLESK